MKTPTDDEIALKRAILKDPADDTVRLAYADYLDEHDQPQRAEFIRVQVELAALMLAWEGDTRANKHARRDELWQRERTLWSDQYSLIGPRGGPEGDWFPEPARLCLDLDEPRHPVPTSDVLGIVVRGFVGAVYIRAAQFCGKQCGRCEGTTLVERGATDPTRHLRPITQTRGDRPVDLCPTCSGTGVVDGWAGSLFPHHPVTRVVLTDKLPSPSGTWSVAGAPWSFPESRQLPAELFRDVLALAQSSSGGNSHHAHFSSSEVALEALGTACVTYGRRLAGLSVTTKPGG